MLLLKDALLKHIALALLRELILLRRGMNRRGLAVLLLLLFKENSVLLSLLDLQVELELLLLLLLFQKPLSLNVLLLLKNGVLVLLLCLKL